VLFTSLKEGDSLGRFVPEYVAHNDPHRLRAVLRWALVVRGGASLLGMAVLLGGAGVIGALIGRPILTEFGFEMALFLAAQNAAETLTILYSALLRARAAAAARTAGQIAGLAFTLLLFWSDGPTVADALYGATTQLAVTALLLLAHLVRQPAMTAAQPPSHVPRPLSPVPSTWFAFAWPIWLSALATFGLSSQVNVLLIARLLPDDTAAGFYALAALIVGRAALLVSGWSVVLLPSAARAQAVGGPPALGAWFRLYARFEYLTSGPVFALIAVGAPGIVRLFGDNYAPAAPLLFWAAALPILSALVAPNVALMLLYALDRQHWVLWLRIGAGVLNVLLSLALIPWLGPLGAVLATAAGNVGSHLVALVLALRAGGLRPPLAPQLRALAATLLAAVLPFWLQPVTLPELVVATALFAVGFAGACWLLKPLVPADLDTLTELRPGLVPLARPFVHG